jgi:phage tail sheath gpL-like
MSVSFYNIPGSIGVPGAYVEFDGSGARSVPGPKPVRILVFGQMAGAVPATTNGSTVPANVPVQCSSAAQAELQFGKHSILTDMLRTLFKVNSQHEVWVAPQLDDPADVAAAWTVTYTTAYADAPALPGTERLYIGGVVFKAAVAAAATAAQVATAMAAAINADTTVPYTASAATGVVTITARHKGECANDLQIHARYYNTDGGPTGLDPAIAQTVTGSGNPDIATAIAATAAGYYTDIISPYTNSENLAAIEAELAARWLPLPGATSTGPGQNDAHCYIAFRGSESQLNTFATGRNSQHVTCMAVEPARTISSKSYPGLLSPVWQVAASYGGQVALEAGVAPNSNLQNVVLKCLIAAPEVSKWTWNERNRFIQNYGLATYKYDDGGNVVLERATTMMTTTTSGVPTDAERDTETQKLNSYLRWSLRQTVLSKYQRYRLAEDGPGVGRQQNVVTPKRLKAEIVALASFWVDQGYMENLNRFKDSIVVERSVTDCNTMNARIEPDHVNQFRVFGAQIGYVVC